MKDSLGDRMKRYEVVSKHRVMPRTPVIIRLDGKAFHTWVKSFTTDSFDETLHDVFVKATMYLCAQIQNATFGFTQSDEISILLNDWKTLTTQQWFNGNISKMTSISASLCTGFFNKLVQQRSYKDGKDLPLALFDSRVFNVPLNDVRNYFLWRIQDMERNSVSMLARVHFSHKEVQGLSTKDMKAKLLTDKGVVWDDMDQWKKDGSIVYRTESNGTRNGFKESFFSSKNVIYSNHFNDALFGEE